MTERVLFMVHSSIDPEFEADFNRWYDEEHAPAVLRAPGALSARRFTEILGPGEFGYVAAYEFADRAAYDAFMSDLLPQLANEYDSRWGTVSRRERRAYAMISEVDRSSGASTPRTGRH